MTRLLDFISRRLLATLFVAALVVLAGCGGPGPPTEEGGVEGEDPGEDTPTDNDAGAEPQNPPGNETRDEESPASPTEETEEDESTPEEAALAGP